MLTSGSSPAAAARRAAELVGVLTGPDAATDSRTLADLVSAVLAEHGEPDIGELTSADVDDLRAAAAELRRVFEAAAVDEAAETLNVLLRRHAGPPRLTRHGDTGWHLHIDADDDGPWGTWLITSSAWALSVLLADQQRLPVGICAAPTCSTPYVDVGHGTGRQYCSTRCATRVRVATHRKRTATDS
ncbi:MAG: CGNR zinc finger domain-containing protein [Streptosporangiales bacterium]|nr:CGNR zinc finger domain-containing protein [Streptosporangiales bacterium]